MPLLPSSTLILTHTLTTLITSYALLTNPASLLSPSSPITPIWLLGESMHIRPPHQTSTSSWTTQPSEPVAAAALLLALLALWQVCFVGGLMGGSVVEEIASREKDGKGKGRQKELTRIEAGEIGEKVYALRAAQTQWMLLAGVRVLVMGALVVWIYVIYGERDGGRSYSSVAAKRNNVEAGGIALLANRVVFSAALVDMLFWGYLWTNVREEGRELVVKVAALRREREEDELLNS